YIYGESDLVFSTDIVPTIRYSLIGANSDANGNPSTLLIPAPVGSPDANGNLIGSHDAPIDPLLAALDANGGTTQTHALLPGSPALNAGDPQLVPPPDADQRGAGFARVRDARIDIGAFESQNESPVVTPPGKQMINEGDLLNLS